MIFIAVALGLLYGFLIRKGNWQSVTRKHFRLLVLLILSVMVEVVLVTPLIERWLDDGGLSASLRTLLAVMQYGMLLVFLGVNSKKPGLLAVMAGTCLNGLVIIFNDGRMPVGEAVSRFGTSAVEKIASAPGYFLASGQEPLLFLGDILPFWMLGWYMISVGDLLIALGLFFLAAYMPRRILRPRPVRSTHAVVQTNDIRYTEGRTKNRYETRTKNRK